jgi:hypothetical protein
MQITRCLPKPLNFSDVTPRLPQYYLECPLLMNLELCFLHQQFAQCIVLPAFRDCLLHNMTQTSCGLALMDSDTEDPQFLQGKEICSRLVRIREPRPVRFVLRDKEIVGAWSRKPMISRDVCRIDIRVSSSLQPVDHK